MRTKSTNEKKIDAVIHRHRHWIIITLVVVVVILLDFAPIVGGGNISTYAKWVECGQRPLRESVQFAASNSVKHYEDVPYFQILGFLSVQQPMYCTPLEAEKAGLSASEHQREYPHLDAAEKNQ